MDIYNADINIDLLEFCDRFGNIRSTSGCSFKGKVEFDARIKILRDILQQQSEEEPDKAIAQIYKEDRNFAHHCDRCLKLNGIDPDWLTEAHLNELLFIHNKKLGALVLLNQANNPTGEVKNQKSKVKSNIYHEFLGALYNFTQDPEQAFRLAQERPFKEVVGMINEVGSKEPTPKTQNLKPDSGMSDRNKMRLLAFREKLKNS